MYCENCKCEHEGSYGSGRFCSLKCARSFSTKNNRIEINKKISNTLKESKSEFKHDNTCISCGAIVINRGRYCQECKPFVKNVVLYKKLGINEKNLKIANDEAIKILHKEYFINRVSKHVITQKYNILSNSLYNFFKKNNIQLRSISEANILALETGRAQVNQHESKYINGWHLTWDKRKIYYRSSYELQYAKYLDSIKEKYYVESLKIKYFDSKTNTIRLAIPDFYLENYNCIVEIKSEFTLDLDNMKDKVKAYKQLGYNVKVLVDFKEIYF